MSFNASNVLKRVVKYSALLYVAAAAQSVFAAEGYATRYWDGCKPHCAWYENADGNPVKTCNVDNEVNPLDTAYDYIASSCDGGDAYTPWNMAPQEISDTLSYGYAAVSAEGVSCGTCYKITFSGTGRYNDYDSGSMAIEGKEMIVMATNIGYDVGGEQFDLLIPGGGVGAFDAASTQWGTDDLGAQYGGFLTECQATYGYDDTDSLKSCVQNKCESVFSQDGMEDLKSGCDWFVDWFEIADNPEFEYEEVSCPSELISIAYDVDYVSDSDTDEDSDNDSDSDTDTDTDTDNDSDSDSDTDTTAGDCSFSYAVESSWNSGYIGSVTVTNNGDSAISSWTSNVTYSDGTEIVNSWNSELSGSAPSYTATNPSWSSYLSAGSSYSWGLQASFTSSYTLPSVTGSCE